MLAVMAADRVFAAMVFGLPLGIAALTHAVPGGAGLGPPGVPSAESQQILVILIVGAFFMGAAAGVREIQQERAIFLRERTVGLSPAAYVTSKVIVFALIGTLQSILLVWAALLGRAGPADALLLGNPTAEIIAVCALVSLTSTVTGLVISSFVTSAEQTMPALVVLVMVQLALSGGLFPLSGRAGLEQLAWLAPVRWGYAAAAATVDLTAHGPAGDDRLWRHSPGIWLWSMTMLLAIGALGFYATVRALRRSGLQRRE
jgi:hypothetical protein